MPLEQILGRVCTYWGFKTLRRWQKEAIRAGLAGRDSVVVLPTGGGKSLCYQVPPLLADRTDIVVAPLISLMKDQVDGLRACGYPAAAVHSGLSNEENNETLRGLRTGRSDAVESDPVKPVPVSFVDAIQSHVSRQVWVMIQIQELTGMRPGEMTAIRGCDLNMTGDVRDTRINPPARPISIF
ncbi:MAG: DEAD/DEAH box helicase, partial [Planctomycetes bacterium]|nr:DEAD/DEAH box helicase [Planctomycetota bacterium]